MHLYKPDVAIVVEASSISTWASHFFAVIHRELHNPYVCPSLALQIYTSLSSGNFCHFPDGRQWLQQSSFHLKDLCFLVKGKALSIYNLKVTSFISFRDESWGGGQKPSFLGGSLATSQKQHLQVCVICSAHSASGFYIHSLQWTVLQLLSCPAGME